MPAYDEEAVLPVSLQEAVDVLEEIATDWELIVVDDGSSDASAKIRHRLGSLPQPLLVSGAKISKPSPPPKAQLSAKRDA